MGYAEGCGAHGAINCSLCLNEADPDNPQSVGLYDMENEVNPNYQHCTVCNLDTSNNIWYVNGQCKLDQLTYAQVYFVLIRVPGAKKDLLRITNDKYLVELANQSELIVPTLNGDQIAAKRINANTLPFYDIMRGNTDGSPGRGPVNTAFPKKYR